MIPQKPLFAWLFEKYWGHQIVLFLMILAAVFLRVFPLEMQKRIVDTAIPMNNIHALMFYCGLYLVAVVLSGGIKYFINLLQAYIGQKVLYEMRDKLYAHTLRLPLNFFRRTPPGTVIASLTSELSTVGDFIGGAIAIPVINLLTLIAFAGYLGYLNPTLAVLSFAVYPVEILLIPLLQARFNRLNLIRINVTRTMSNIIAEAISGMHEIHGNASYGVESAKLTEQAGKLFHLRNRMNNFKFLIKFTNNFFQSLGPFTLFLVGGYLTTRGRLDLGALVAFLSAYEKLYDPWKELMDYYQDFQDAKVRYRQVMDYFDEEPEFILAPEDGRAPCQMTGNIRMQDVSLRIDGHTQILDGVSLSVRSGEQIALVGPSGSGKSSLAMVIAQLYKYTHGHVFVDEMELKNLSKLDVSSNIGFVPQYPFIFDGPILDNLMYAYRSLTRAPEVNERPLDLNTVLSMIESVGLSDDILNLGLHTRLNRENHKELANRLVQSRKLFFEQSGGDFERVVDFIDLGRFQRYSSIAENITFGEPVGDGYSWDALYRNHRFLRFLTDSELIDGLTELGAEIAVNTVSLLEGLEEEPFFFEMSPIPREEFQPYSDIAARIHAGGPLSLDAADAQAVLRLALRFVPARHTMALLTQSLADRIVRGRQAFMKSFAKIDPVAFTFYNREEYLFNQSVINNVLFGNPKAVSPQATQIIKEKVVDFLTAEGLVEDIMSVGLEFQVGSKGDRLSGGQKQKIAIARALLKAPRILVLDEVTASLDNTSQARIHHLLNNELRGRFTLVSVVHRLELVKEYDEVVVMRSGSIVESGKYKDLMKKRGVLYELAQGFTY